MQRGNELKKTWALLYNKDCDMETKNCSTREAKQAGINKVNNPKAKRISVLKSTDQKNIEDLFNAIVQISFILN